jgi:hypothetical protein
MIDEGMITINNTIFWSDGEFWIDITEYVNRYKLKVK